MAGLGPRAQELAGRVAVVTGAGQGMGRAIARKLACRGACVAALDLNLAAVQETVSGMEEADAEGGGRRGHAALACDVGDSGAVDAAFERIEAHAGPVSILVNNAGIGRVPHDGSERMYALMAKRNEELAVGGPARTHVDHIPYMEDAGWAGVLRVNLDGAFFCARAAVRSMIKADRPGAIVSIASTAAQSGEGPVHYVTSKAALIGLTRALARELGSRGIRVNAVAPGPTNTPIMQGIPEQWVRDMENAIPLGRMAEPEEVAEAVCWLASDAASMCTGAVLVANGGSYFF